MAGNTAILKTSEMSPRTHMYLAEIMQQAGLPDGGELRFESRGQPCTRTFCRGPTCISRKGALSTKY